MQFPITIVPTYAIAVLKNHTCGSVHSIYNKTINLQFGNYLLSLQTAGSPLSPVSLITELCPGDMAGLRLEPGQTVTSEHHSITFTTMKHSFTFADAHIVDLELTPPSTPIPKALIGEALFRSHAGGFGVLFADDSYESSATAVPGNQELVLSAARHRIDSCTQYFTRGAYEKAVQELVRLLGLGIGLTPSGDDFLCGVLAGLTLCGQICHPFSNALQAVVREHLYDTNDISRTFLTCALQSHFSYAVVSILHTASPDAILTNFEAIGHSSGIDTLCGIYYGLSLFP